MDLPPRFRRHPRYGDVRHPPCLVNHHLTPPAPPPLPPLPPQILLPFPSHFSSHPYPPILERSYFQESDPLREPYSDCYPPPLNPPPHQESLLFRIRHDYSRRGSIIGDEILLRGCNNSYVYDFPRELPFGAMEGNSRISELQHRRYSSAWVSGIDARGTWNDTNFDARRWENGISGSRDLYFDREDDVRRRHCGINGGRELCFDRNTDSRGWECVISGGREFSFDRDDDRIRLDYGINDGISLRLDNRPQEFLESNLGLHRFSGRLGRREGIKREFPRPRKMNRVRKKSALHRIQLEAPREHIRGKKILKNLSSSSSLKGREKENFEGMKITKDNQDTDQSRVDLSISFKSNSLVAKAILAASSSVSKEEICLSTRNQKIRKINNMFDTGSAHTSEVVTEQIIGFQSGVPCPQIELLEDFNVSFNENVSVHKANSSGVATEQRPGCNDNLTAHDTNPIKVVTEQMLGFQSSVVSPQIEPLENFSVSVNGNVTADKANSNEVVTENIPGFNENVTAHEVNICEVVTEQTPGFQSGVVCPKIELLENFNTSVYENVTAHEANCSEEVSEHMPGCNENVTAHDANSSEVVMEQIPGFQSGVLCPRIVVLENFNASINGNGTGHKANSSKVVTEQMPGFNGNVTALETNSSEFVVDQMPGFQSGVLCPQIDLLENFNISGNGKVTADKANSSEVVTEQMSGFQCGVLCPQIELLEKFNVTGNENVTAYQANSSGNNFMENEALDNFRSCRRLGRKAKKNIRNKYKILHGTRLQLSENSCEVVKFETSTGSTSDASKEPSLGIIAYEKVDIGSDTNGPSFFDRKMKDNSLNNLSAFLPLSDDAGTECPAKDANCASQLGTDEVAVHAGGSCLVNENIGHGDGFGFKWHADSVELHVQKWDSILDPENLLDSKNLLTSLGAVRVDSSEQPHQDGLVFGNAFDQVPFECPSSVEVENITGLSRHHETNISKVQEDENISEQHKTCALECENSWSKQVENVVYDMRSADVNSKQFFLQPITIPEIEGYFPPNSENAKVSVAAAVADYSSVSISTVTRSNFLSGDHEGTVAKADISSVKTDDQFYKDGVNLSNRSCCIEGMSESRIKRKRKRKKKARGTLIGISGSNATEPLHKGSSVDDGRASLLATDISSVKETDFPGAEDNSEVKFRLKDGFSVDQDSRLDAVVFSRDGPFTGNIKKRKVVDPRLDFSSCLADSIRDCLSSEDLKLDQVSLRPVEQDADQREETLSGMHVASTDGSENFSIPEMDDALGYGNNNLLLKDDLDFICNTLSLCADGSDDCATQSGDELVASGLDTPSCVSSPEDLLSHTDFHSESEMMFEEFQTSNIKPLSSHYTTFPVRKSIEIATLGHLQTNTKVPPALPQKTDKVPSSKNKLSSAVRNIYSGDHTSRKFPSTHFIRSKTWHRTEQSSVNVSGPTLQPCPLPQSRAPKTPRISQSSYVRKGNSLVRKPPLSGGAAAHTPSSSAYPRSPCIDYLKNNQVKVDTPPIPRVGQVNPSESSQLLPLNHTGRTLRSASCHSVQSLPVRNSLGSGGPVKTVDALKETVKSSEIPECQNGSGNNSDCLSTLSKENLGKKISYVKRRSNQLIATSDPKDSFTPGLDKSGASLSDGYYENSKKYSLGRGGPAKTIDALKETVKSSEIPECQNGSGNSSDSLIITLGKENLGKKISYVKRRSNQLIATSDHKDSFTPGLDKFQASLSDGYYENSKKYSLGSGDPAKTVDALKETVQSFEIPECQNGSGNSSDSLIITLGTENLGKRISYVKRRSNQLIATSDPKDSFTPGLDKSRASLSDGYYKNSTKYSVESGGPAKTVDAFKETVKSSEIPECQNDSGNNLDNLRGREDLGKNISYVKRRSNQLIATPDPKDSFTPGLDKSQASLSDGYYKNSKNQLVRVSSESHAIKGDSVVTLNTCKLGSQTILPMSFGKRQSSKGLAKTCRLSKSPLVWNLNGAQLPGKSNNSLGPRKVWPYLLPWRRATYRRSSLPTISQKLLLSSKRGAIYKRSTYGYSLRISKVLSVCGRSLKWSKSIERNSKKANEEATRAVAAAEKRKKEEKSVIPILSKSKNHVYRKSVSVKLCPGERIFRFGSDRYKMDPSRRSLHRITEEEEPSHSDVLQSEKKSKKSYVPKRLLIGNDEYVRIGTGNQLVRDPKKRTRVLASEKVRWSLRTARLRLARKRKYCQFFTRFGKCNKSSGKCPYIHDPSKVVVCTKFLNGSCTDGDCKLTHKVIPERMPDCSYFMKGSCSNENCPYRHVNVNPESSICKRFLRGYCADGNECQKKHTYVCPAFESTGICPLSSMCKLHHPKKKTEKKPVIEQTIVRGRYFDGGLIDAAACDMVTDEKLCATGDDDIVCEEGKYPDFISLDISDVGPEMSIS